MEISNNYHYPCDPFQEGLVYAVEFSHRSGRDLLNVAKRRTNIIPIIEDARHPHKYRMLVGSVDCVFADVAQPDQARIVSLNAQQFLKTGGHFVISIKVSCTILSLPQQSQLVSLCSVQKMKLTLKTLKEKKNQRLNFSSGLCSELNSSPNPSPINFTSWSISPLSICIVLTWLF